MRNKEIAIVIMIQPLHVQIANPISGVISTMEFTALPVKHGFIMPA